MGMGFNNANSIIIMNKYFKRRVGAAFGILLTGFGLGGLAMPQVRWRFYTCHRSEKHFILF
jgi:hypothetical protein